MDAFTSLADQKYINLETFRKSGQSMKTAVWFVQDGDTLYVRTIANSGKVKRIRNNGQVNIAPCKVDGALLGEWIPATAREVKDSLAEKKTDRLLDRKYGLMKRVFALTSAMKGQEYTVLEIKPREQHER